MLQCHEMFPQLSLDGQNRKGSFVAQSAIIEKMKHLCEHLVRCCTPKLMLAQHWEEMACI